MRCPSCARENRAGRRFCGGCGVALPRTCPRCAAANEPDDQRFFEAELHRLMGEAHEPPMGGATMSLPLAAESWFRRAMQLARRREVRSLELRAAMSLARLWQADGKTAEARALLGPVFGWFTEGFDSPDPEEAKQLLGELS